jgi:glucosamine-phosphate N-acetyltransferase
MNIRPICKNDFYKNFTDLLSQLSTTGNITYQNFINIINSLNNNHLIYVIEDNNKIIASGTLLIENKFIHNCSKVGHIEDIVVDKKYRGHGLGKQIVNYLVDKSKELNCYKVILNCNEYNKPFYEKMGFTNKNIEMSKYFNI